MLKIRRNNKHQEQINVLFFQMTVHLLSERKKNTRDRSKEKTHSKSVFHFFSSDLNHNRNI